MHARQQRQVGHFAGDAAGYARVLDLQREHKAVMRLGAVHLAARCSGDRLEAEAAEASMPATALFALDQLDKPGRRHHMGLVALAAQQFGEMWRQHALAVHRHELAYLHHRAPYLRQPSGEPA